MIRLQRFQRYIPILELSDDNTMRVVNRHKLPEGTPFHKGFYTQVDNQFYALFATLEGPVLLADGQRMLLTPEQTQTMNFRVLPNVVPLHDRFYCKFIQDHKVLFQVEYSMSFIDSADEWATDPSDYDFFRWIEWLIITKRRFEFMTLPHDPPPHTPSR